MPKIQVRLLVDREVPAKCLVKNMYFGAVLVLRCYAGRFRFELDGARQVVELSVGEALVIYPEHCVSVWALADANRLIYGAFVGEGCGDYFDALGFFDLARGKTAPQYENICALKRGLKFAAEGDPKMTLEQYVLMTNILRTIARDMRLNGGGLVFDAIRQLRENLKRQIVRLEPLCRDLGVSRSCLHSAFKRAGLGTPAEVIRKEQLALALTLLRTTRLPITEVAQRAGFISVAHFSTFIKTRTGTSPRQIRLLGITNGQCGT